MKILNNFFLNSKKIHINKNASNDDIDQYEEIGRLLKEARIQKNLSIEDLSRISKIPENSINSIENNIENVRPKYPFIRSILLKLEACLSLNSNTLVGLLTKDVKPSRQDKRKYLVRRFDFFNTWEGSILYFLTLILSLFILKRYFFYNTTIIEIQNFEQKIDKN